MYEAFYGLKKKPFSMLPDPDFLFLSKKHQAALTLLRYGVTNHAGFCVVSGEPGAGKTTIVRAFLQTVGNDVAIGLITNTHRSFGGLLDWILSAFNLHRPNLTQVEMHQIFMDYLIAEYAKNRSVLLIVDEAQNMSADALEELRMLSNVNSGKDQLIQIILVGQPALKGILSQPELIQFAQRIAVDYHLALLDLEETCGYIQHRLITAGAERDVFTPAACERIYNHSGGTPRLINLLCETVLVYGFADQLEMIDVDMVDEMVQERMKDSVVPILNRDIAKQAEAKSNIAEIDFPWIRAEANEPDLKPQTAGTPDIQQQTIEDEDIAKLHPAALSQSSDEAMVSETVAIHQAKEIEVPADNTAESESENGQKPGKQTPVNAQNTVYSDKQEVADRVYLLKSLFKYGAASAVLALILIAVAIVLDDENNIQSEITNNKFVESQKLIIREETDNTAKEAVAVSEHE